MRKAVSRVLKLSEPDAWLTLVSCTAGLLERALDLLGMHVPERM
jgi:arginyl-tRNA synthetase